MLRRLMMILVAGFLIACVDYGIERDDPDEGPVVGRACEVGDDCGEEFECYLNAPGGYCLLSRDCMEDAECPSSAVCAPRMLSARPGTCLRICEDAGDCREGYICGYVEMAPGSDDGPVSSAPVCWVPCIPGMDQLCNDNPMISSLHGECNDDGTCSCEKDWDLNPDTGRCR